jgi:hypothetical protein
LASNINEEDDEEEEEEEEEEGFMELILKQNESKSEMSSSV